MNQTIFDATFRIPPMGDDSIKAILRPVASSEEYLSKLVHAAEGNPGAANAIVAMHEVDDRRAPFSIGACVAWNITGPMLWLLYKDVNHQDAAAMLKMIEMEEAPGALEDLPYSHYRAPTS
jgi:hypothetical protein